MTSFHVRAWTLRLAGKEMVTVEGTCRVQGLVIINRSAYVRRFKTVVVLFELAVDGWQSIRVGWRKGCQTLVQVADRQVLFSFTSTTVPHSLLILSVDMGSLAQKGHRKA